tara:strand:- start:178 stop:429 length:252 start_codon:yes stop_codon:yes gene_type:complete
MDQLNKIKLEKDPMANSWENDKMVITAEFANMARALIEKGVEDSKDAVNQVSSFFPNNNIFHDLFPIIFNIELCKSKLKAQNA